MKIIPALFGAIAILSFLFVPLHGASAALVQCNPAVIGSCNLCALLATVQAVVNFIIALGFIMVTLVTILAGLSLYASKGNPHAFGDAMKQLTNGVIGFAIMLSAWVILNTVLNFFAKGSVLFWNKISC